MLKQVALEYHNVTRTERVCWVKMKPGQRIRKGSRISLDGDKRIWTVTDVFATVKPTDIKRGWHNNI